MSIRNVPAEISLANLTQEKAIGMARVRVYAEAAKILGVNITSAESMFQGESYSSLHDRKITNHSFQSLITGTAKALVTKTENERWEVMNKNRGDPSKPPDVSFRLTADAEVEMPAGQRDPSLKIYVKLDRPSYKHGEEIGLSITTSKDCYVQLFTIVRDSVMLVFPNDRARDNFVRSEEVVKFPLYAILPDDWEHSEEQLLVVGTLNKLDFREGIIVQFVGYADCRKARWIDLAQYLIEIPLNNRVEVFEEYEITR
jgi:hypothetical protein